jgi:hypothetical protein
MQKLYKQEAGRVRWYHEAWQSGREIVEHWGELGTPGDVKRHPLAPGSNHDDQLHAVLLDARKAGYAPIGIEEHRTLLVEYTVQGMGTAKDLKKRQALEDQLNALLGWTGLGHCDGGSIGSGTMEACCFVVDFDVAKRVVQAGLQGTPFGDFARIYQEDDA